MRRGSLKEICTYFKIDKMHEQAGIGFEDDSKLKP
jgi:hypothetical protein